MIFARHKLLYTCSKAFRHIKTPGPQLCIQTYPSQGPSYASKPTFHIPLHTLFKGPETITKQRVRSSIQRTCNHYKTVRMVPTCCQASSNEAVFQIQDMHRRTARANVSTDLVSDLSMMGMCALGLCKSRCACFFPSVLQSRICTAALRAPTSPPTSWVTYAWWARVNFVCARAGVCVSSSSEVQSRICTVALRAPTSPPTSWVTYAWWARVNFVCARVGACVCVTLQTFRCLLLCMTLFVVHAQVCVCVVFLWCSPGYALLHYVLQHPHPMNNPTFSPYE